MTQRRILVTAALPYANGPIHIGHLVEYIQTDIWVRFQKLRGHNCIYICADDTHGTAIMIRARQEGRGEDAVIAEAKVAHERDFAAIDVVFDNFGSTHSPENEKLCGEMWQSIRNAGLVKEKDVEQLFDVREGTFLADRFVRGTCPNPQCGAANQPGDNCSKCGSTYTTAELIDPISTLSGTTPEIRSAKHLFIELEQLHDFLDQWTESDEHLQPEVLNYLKGHFLGDASSAEGRKTLKDWDISRPAPYFGFEIPDSPGNYWYVWFDAPIGYMASTLQWCERNGESFDDWWRNEATEIHHFIGKDITYFHTLFWPGMLKSAGYNLPTKVHIHGFLTVNGEKMSKSTGSFVTAETYLKHLDPSYLRYYYASKLGSRLDDIDMNLAEFAAKIDSDLVGKVVNLASRCAKFAAATGLSKSYPEDGGLFEQAAKAGDEIAAAYEQCDYNRATRLIIELAGHGNRFIDAAAHWKFKDDPSRAQELQDVCTIGLNLFRQIVIYLAPVLPALAKQTEELLGTPIDSWDDSQSPLAGTPVAPFSRMMNRVQKKDIDAMIEESKEEEVAAPPASPYNDSGDPLKSEPLAEQCTIDDFVKVDMRIARVLTAEDVPEANKLLKLTLGLGGEETRTVFAGIKEAYKPEDLVGRLVVCCANLAPRKMKFGTSEGMILASGSGKADVFMLRVDEGGQPGQRVH